MIKHRRTNFLLIPTSVLFLLLMLMLLSSLTSAHASTQQWPLRQQGEVRYLKMIKVYDISLYSPTKLTASNVLEPHISKCLKLDYAVSLTQDKFKLATAKILHRQYSADYLASIKKPLEKLQNAFLSVKKGDSHALCYNGKNQIMRFSLNDKPLTEIKSAELAKAFLGIWLSNNKPISTPLYRAFFPKQT